MYGIQHGHRALEFKLFCEEEDDDDDENLIFLITNEILQFN